MAHRREKKLEKQRSRDSPVTPKGKQTVKQLIGQNQGVSNIEINDPSIREFEADRPQVRRGLCGEKGPQHLAAQVPDLLQGPRRRRLTAAFSEYTQKKVKKADRSERPSVLEKLASSKSW